ncbi:MAG: PLP-dependent aminotransferase family protein [Halanaerobiales bacterium]
MEDNFDLNRDKGENLYIQLYKILEKKILTGELRAHTRLPAIRKMAEETGVNPATVVKAYDLLERKDLIYKKVGSGSYVAPLEVKRNSKKNIVENKQKSIDEIDMLGYGQLQLADSINFASATPSPSLFPVENFKVAINGVLERDKGKAFTYQKSQGYYPLRESIGSYLKEINIDTDIDNIQIVSGAQQAIDLLVKVLADYGEEVLVEEPTYTGAISALESRKAAIKGIPLMTDGMDLNILEDELKTKQVEFVYIMSSFQNPTGISWSEEKKKSLLWLAEKYDFFIVEDDCLSELYFVGEKPLPLKSYDRSQRVIYIKSFSKIFMPGLRLAFLVLPEDLLSPLLAAKHATDISSAGLTQRAFDYYLRKGLWSEHLSDMRELFGRRFNWMEEAIKDHLPSPIKLFNRPKGGLYFWLSLPEGYASKDLYKLSTKKGVAFIPGELFSVKPLDSPYFRLSFADVNHQEIERGIQTLADAVKKLLQEEKPKGYTPLV